jgi:hypothetical protein
LPAERRLDQFGGGHARGANDAGVGVGQGTTAERTIPRPDQV